MNEIDNISRKLMSLEKPKKPKMLVVDDEPDNLDLLYRTFRRDFNVFRAEGGSQALDILSAEGEVAVIISDQRMPEMKGTEFLSKTVPQFPDTVRIILTGFTDVEDLVDAINSGQVYKYITKPWEPNELKGVVQRAADTYELLKLRTEELHRSQAQTKLLATIVEVAQQSINVENCLPPIAEAFGRNFAADGCILQMVEGSKLTSSEGNFSTNGNLQGWLSQDSLATEAIATQTLQAWANVPDSTTTDLEKYQTAGLQAHLVVPISFRGKTQAVLSLQWKQPSKLREDELQLIHLSAQQIGLAIASIQSLA